MDFGYAQGNRIVIPDVTTVVLKSEWEVLLFLVLNPRLCLELIYRADTVRFSSFQTVYVDHRHFDFPLFLHYNTTLKLFLHQIADRILLSIGINVALLPNVDT